MLPILLNKVQGLGRCFLEDLVYGPGSINTHDRVCPPLRGDTLDRHEESNSSPRRMTKRTLRNFAAHWSNTTFNFVRWLWSTMWRCPSMLDEVPVCCDAMRFGSDLPDSKSVYSAYVDRRHFRCAQFWRGSSTMVAGMMSREDEGYGR